MGAASGRKQLRKSLKPLHEAQGVRPKSPRHLIDLAQRYLDCEDDLDAYRRDLSIAATAWNLSLFPSDSRDEHLMKRFGSVSF
jgi:hypothetical protein